MMENTKKLLGYLLSAFKSLLIYTVTVLMASVQAGSLFNPHIDVMPDNQRDAECISCHKDIPDAKLSKKTRYLLPDMNQFKQSETGMCVSCHGEENRSHIIGVTPDYTVPADLPLNKNNQVTCLTCHYVHGSLQSDKTMASASFMDHLFNRDRLNKSYTLRRNNSEGDLCLACHSK